MIREFDYNSITLQNIADNEHLEFICDGDRKKVVVNSNFANNLEKSLKPLVEAINSIAKIVADIWDKVKPVINHIFEFQNTKITKKRLKKLLQSYGIQRNKINKIVANNKDPYTYKKLYETLNLYKKESE